MEGLTTSEVEERISKGLINEDVSSSTRTVKEIVKENVLTYFNLIFAVLAVLLIIERKILFMRQKKLIVYSKPAPDLLFQISQRRILIYMTYTERIILIIKVPLLILFLPIFFFIELIKDNRFPHIQHIEKDA